jgi:voltage-gated potassium channel
MVMITGYSIIAVPTGIFTAELANAMRGEQLQTRLPHVQKSSHEPSRLFVRAAATRSLQKMQ